VRIAIVGCGFVADLYAGTLPLHPDLELVGVFDRDPARAHTLGGPRGARVYAGLDELLADARIETVLNLTPPDSHAGVTRAALAAGKHVYSEKPLAMDLEEASALAAFAEERGLRLSGAPCSVLGGAAQTLWRALRENQIGTVRVVYAEMDDGMLHRMPYERWRRPSGVPWPYRSEFETGCTLEHAGYTVTWLIAFFGPAREITAFRSVQVPDKRPGEPIRSAPDLSVAAIRFESGVVARLTCSILAPRDHGIRVIGDEGVLSVRDSWFYSEPVLRRRWLRLGRRFVLSPLARRCRPARPPTGRLPRRGAAQMDYLLGVQELADALRAGRPSRLGPDFCLHANEVVLAIHGALGDRSPYLPVTRCAAIAPMPWAD
jgi:predicted dehydrogenase